MTSQKKTILIDLDGVLNTYNGNFNDKYIPPIKDRALEFIKDLSNEFKVVIFTSRNLLITSKLVIENKLDKYIENITNIKEPCYLIIDDRCITFDGDFNKLKNKIKDFSVWYNNQKIEKI